jgi:hypothetical protein
VVGAYLNKLGFGYKAIIYFTETSPEGAEWFDFAKAKELGIKVTRLAGTKKTTQPAQYPQMKPTPHVQAPPAHTPYAYECPKSVPFCGG